MRALPPHIIAALLLCAPATAGSPADMEGRYILKRAEDGFFRTDRLTGTSSFCRPAAGTWTCRLVPDDLAAFEEEITRLNRQIEALETAREAEEAGREPADKPPAATAPDGLDAAMERIERAIRDFLTVMRAIRGHLP